MNKVKYMTVHFLFQSPSNALVSDGISENPNLKDNWDDAEGYYRKYTKTNDTIICELFIVKKFSFCAK